VSIDSYDRTSSAATHHPHGKTVIAVGFVLGLAPDLGASTR
jgi:hypothetical protein